MAKISLHENFANFLFRKIKTIVYRLRTGKKQAKFSFYEVELHLWYLMYSLFAIKKIIEILLGLFKWLFLENHWSYSSYKLYL